jgi:hypothetical protein
MGVAMAGMRRMGVQKRFLGTIQVVTFNPWPRRLEGGEERKLFLSSCRCAFVLFVANPGT